MGDAILEENISKRLNTGVKDKNGNDNKVILPNDKEKQERCNICKQYSDEVALYNGHPNKSAEEFVALTDEKLSLFTGKEEFVDEQDERPTHKVTYFSIYDKNGHLCHFDTGFVEKNVLLYFSGYLKPVYDEDPSTNNGVPAHDMGPINEWWTAGFDGGERALVGFSTCYAEYYLVQPSEEYQPIWNKVKEKIHLSKIVIEYLLDDGWQNPTYEDLLQHIQTSGDYPQAEESLLRHAQFLSDQVVNFDSNAKEDEKALISAPCMRSLVKMAGVTFSKRKQMRRTESKGIKIKTQTWTKATTTKLVREVFENFFFDQIDSKESKDDKGPRKKRCGVCEACQTPDCGECAHCRDMLKFGGTGRGKQACKKRKCPNMAIQEAEESENEDEVEVNSDETSKHAGCSKRILHSVEFQNDPILIYKGRNFYKEAVVGELVVNVGDHVMLNSENPSEPAHVARIAYMYEMSPVGKMCHAHLFLRGADTILGNTSDPRELFVVDNCVDVPLGSIVRSAKVERLGKASNWSEVGGLENLPHQMDDDGCTFFYMNRYEENRSRFIDYVDNPEDQTSFNTCNSCRRKSNKKRLSLVQYENGEIKWMDEVYKTGTGVFLKPETYKFKNLNAKTIFDFNETKENNVNSNVYPEYYRKTSDNIKGSNVDTPEPFLVGLIEEAFEKNDEIVIRVRIFYSPLNTSSSLNKVYQKDINCVYWTDEVFQTSFDNVVGKCYLAYGENLENAPLWCDKGPYRFHFNESYDPKTYKFGEVPSAGTKLGRQSKGKGKAKSKSNKPDTKVNEMPPEWAKIERPLRSMDVFAGCGGLSEGLHQAGISESKWAIEKEVAAAQAFRLNNPACKVFTDDCNNLLQLVMTDEKQAVEKGLPRKGEVELLVGGPPCQGFSGMNRFNAGQYSLFKNSLIVSYLSYCEYYRPKYFILENVRNFVSFKRSVVLKLTLRCLLAMGYQVTFGILQAGHYGIPQTRRRLILMAAAPGYEMPKYPEPLHVFNKRGCQLSFVVDGTRFNSGNKWTESAPYRTVTVRDALSDLPDIKNGCNESEIVYDSYPHTHFQRKMRGDESSQIVKDHICKEMAPIVEARIAQIPSFPGSDWRDLPNMVVRLNDGSFTQKLRYPYRSKKQKKDDPPKGVCQCAVGGKSCDQADRQFNTLIPWCLPHTADRHNNWAGLYGRLEWEGFFGTTITNPEPMGKQGRVLHPEQNRVVSVRECARSQGFPDRFKFHGNILDKHRQVGNAVPPPMGAAIGKEILIALSKSKHNYA